jgi:hypothetical protein
MNYKKILAGFALFFLAVFVGWQVPRNFLKQEVISPKPRSTFILNTGQSVATYDGILAATAYDALIEVSSRTAIPVEKKQYDFGVFVEKIGDYGNTKEKAWIYYVNGVSGDVAADKKVIKAGDVVEWRYEKPLY